jgi:hypothetical protein
LIAVGGLSPDPAEEVGGAAGADFPDVLRPVAELKGICLEALPEGVQEELKKALER